MTNQSRNKGRKKMVTDPTNKLNDSTNRDLNSTLLSLSHGVSPQYRFLSVNGEQTFLFR